MEFVDYEHINQDTLKTVDKCLAMARGFLKIGKPVVIDSTNVDRTTRAKWVSLGLECGVKVAETKLFIVMLIYYSYLRVCVGKMSALHAT